MDELGSLLDAVAEQDAELPRGAPTDVGPTAALVRGLIAKGRRPPQIAAELGVNRSTVTYRLRKLGLKSGGVMWAANRLRDLGRSGVRASELCDLRIGQVRLHDPGGARFRIPDSKTETGIREV